MTVCRATSTFAAAWRRSRLLAIASATIASRRGSWNDLSQLLSTPLLFPPAIQWEGMVVPAGSALSTTCECDGAFEACTTG